LKEHEFIQHYIAHAPQIMWFLGAGVSRSAGMPTAADITWDLKKAYYCRQENQDIQKHDINKDAIKEKIQNYMNGKGFPALWSPEEYSFYFKLTFNEDYAAQQAYLQDQLNPQRISLSVGHRALAALIEVGKVKVIFTTNFDNVAETAYSHVTGKPLNCFHLEGSYAALQALNSEQFPIYAKLHGDFRYKSLKNLEQDLKKNDEEIQKCFVNACSRYGLIVAGYSGRDQNVMEMLNAALENGNPFPHGLFWAVPPHGNLTASVQALIDKAKAKGVKADIVEIDTFDSLLSRIWLQTPNRPAQLNGKVQTAKSKTVNISLAAPARNFPLIKTNAFEVTAWPVKCKKIQYAENILLRDIRHKEYEEQADAIITKTSDILAWGLDSEIQKILDAQKITAISEYDLSTEAAQLDRNTVLQSFYERAMATALCQGKPIRLRRNHSDYFLIVDHAQLASPLLQPLKNALALNGGSQQLTGQIQWLENTFWSEAVEIKLEQRGGRLWMLLRPDIWIKPNIQRKNAAAFLKSMKERRYNPKADAIHDAWLQLLLGSDARGTEIVVPIPDGNATPERFVINNCPAFSGRA
jgi:NAD-dependent SIR2 family protein deacetylase